MDREALSRVHADLAQAVAHRVAFHPFGDGALALRTRHAGDRAHDGVVERIPIDLAYEQAIDLEDVDGQVLEIGERRKPAPEIVQGNRASMRVHGFDERARLRQPVDGGGLGQLEAELRGDTRMFRQHLVDPRQEVGTDDGLARHVHMAQLQLAQMVWMPAKFADDDGEHVQVMASARP